MRLQRGEPLLKVAWFYIAILPALTNAQNLAPEFYVFDQCECRDKGPFLGSGSPFGFSAIPEGLVLQGGDIVCQDDETGFINANIGKPEQELIGVFDPEFFLSNDGADKVSWAAMFDFQLIGFDENTPAVPLILFNLGDDFDIDVSFDTFVADGAFIDFSGQTVTRDPQDQYRIFFGESIVPEDGNGRNAFTFCIFGSNLVIGEADFDCDGDDAVVGFVTADPNTFGGNNPPSTVTIFPALVNGPDFENESIRLIAAAFDREIVQFDVVERAADLDDIIGGELILELIKQPPLPLPVDPINNFTVDEDNTLTESLVNLVEASGLNIDFVDIVGGDRGVFTLLNAEEFEYVPNPNEFGDDFFSVFYTSPDVVYQCALEIPNLIVVIKPLNDVPILIEDEIDQQTIGLIQSPGLVIVAIDLDIEGNDTTLLEGFVTIETLPVNGELFEADCETPLVEQSTVELNDTDGSFAFCYIGNERNFEEDTDSFTYTVSDLQVQTQKSDIGTINLLGGDPVVIPDVLRQITVLENDDNTPPIVVDERFSARAEGVEEDVAANIRIETLPAAADGRLVFNDEDVVQGQLIPVDAQSRLQFIPAPDRFNAIGGSGRNVDNVDVTENCPVDTIGQDVCPFQFEFVLAFGANGDAIIGEPTPFNIIVDAVDDVAAEVTGTAPAELTANVNDVVNGFVPVNINGFEVQRDADADAFTTTITLRGNGGVEIVFQDVNPLITVSGFNAERVAQGNCDDNDNCVEATLIGFTSQLNSLFLGGSDSVRAFVPIDGQAGTISLTITVEQAAENDNFRVTTVEFELEDVQDGFFDDQNNVIYAAAVGGGLVFIGIIAAVVRITTVRADEGGVAALEEDKPVRFQARGNVKSSGDKRRSFKDDDDEPVDEKDEKEEADEVEETAAVPAKEGGGDPLLDWEKHIDPKTKEPFYHNPQTGETVWELPDI